MIDTKNEIREYIVENFLFGDSETTILDEDSFMEKGILDSTGILDLITFIESRYEITIDDNEIIPENLDSLEKINTFINKKKN